MIKIIFPLVVIPIIVMLELALFPLARESYIEIKKILEHKKNNDEGWILCNKKLPKNSNIYWITYNRTVIRARFIPDKKCWFTLDDFSELNNTDVIAWKEYCTPTPYRGKDESNVI